MLASTRSRGHFAGAFLARSLDKPVAQVARDLGISPCTLHNWVQAERRRTERSQGAVTEPECEEPARLRAEKARWAKEKAELEMERDVLKRSVVLWVRDTMNQ